MGTKEGDSSSMPRVRDRVRIKRSNPRSAEYSNPVLQKGNGVCRALTTGDVEGVRATETTIELIMVNIGRMKRKGHF